MQFRLALDVLLAVDLSIFTPPALLRLPSVTPNGYKK